MWSFSAGHRTRNNSTCKREILLGFLTKQTDPRRFISFVSLSFLCVQLGCHDANCSFLSSTTGPVMFHVRRRPADSNSQTARRRKKKLSGSGGSQGGGGNANANSCGSGGGSVHRLTGVGDLSSPDQDPEQRTLPYLVELNPDGSEVRQGNQIRRHFVSPTVTEVGSERPAPPHPSSPISGEFLSHFVADFHPQLGFIELNQFILCAHQFRRFNFSGPESIRATAFSPTRKAW
jgi:hypothetical protein